ncbi:histidinol dehydrogenase [Methanomethylovorans hollandica DSM 15978]|uniref:Histidinol dehydrogenase n=1 Tax=Methanomethylovorans hollandica (strain DSM 15978 / NBRC 107637 / DMS1) TaxID=867904 RepID=L0KZB6_METHD|nr:histidinol dehydrogenase [Methanomethylovorans hollandica]AGB50040.1 histidinol dehydrogenase [Methanomethylovorans hollandica DSM 15978]
MLYGRLSEFKEKEIKALIERGGELANVSGTVSSILADVLSKGDVALREYTQRFDGAMIDAIEVSRDEIENAYNSTDQELIKHLEIAANNIRKFHEAQMPEKMWFMQLSPGIELGQKATALASVGAYVPGGRASYPSTALMTIIPAKVAGVRKVVMCTPPGPDGKVNPLTLAAAKVAGADHVYRVGGVQAIAAMAYGTDSVMKVDKIVGPGNVYVTSAKMQIRDRAEIDFPAGPSEVLIIADESAYPAMVAADMIAQAEHDPQAVSVLVTNSETLASKVKEEVLKQAQSTIRGEIVGSSLKNAAILIAESIEQCIDFSNSFAPEHLEIITNDDETVLQKIEHAGSIFMGNYAPVPVGDYASGTNHVLPTAGYARMYSGLNIMHFLKISSIQRINKEGLATIMDTVISLAEKEGLQAHADAIRIRFSS